MTTVSKVLTGARQHVGKRETPDNKTEFGRWYGADGNPWCAMFVSFVFAHAGLPLPASSRKGFAYTPSGAKWFRDQGRWSTKPHVGDVVFFRMPGTQRRRINHVGIVEAVHPDGSITTIEGNTTPPGGRGSERTGGAVARKKRNKHIAGYGRPRYTGR